MNQRRHVVRSSAELETCWRSLVEPLGFGSRQLFALLIDRDGEVFRSIIHVTSCPVDPDPVMVGNLAAALRSAMDQADPRGTCAILWARPTCSGTRAGDLEWARVLKAELDHAGLTTWPVHFADDAVLSVVAPDDLAA